MERGKFVRAFNKASDELDKKKLRKVTNDIIKSIQKRDGNDRRNYLIIMEELAELSQQISKAGRGMKDKTCLMEEMADVVICLVRLQHICGVSTLDLYKSINVKVDRMEQVLKTEGIYL